MRVRFAMYSGGREGATICECDLTPKEARARFNDLKTNAKCGWCELVAEDEDEGGYMEIIDSYENIPLARTISQLI